MSADEELRAQLDDLLGADTDTESVLRAFEQAPSLLAVCEGSDLVLTALNAAAREVYGDRLGVPVREALDDPVGEEIAAWTEEAFGSGTPQQDRLWRMPEPGGQDPRDERWLRFSLVPSRGPDGAVCGVISLAVDVTEEVQARAAEEARAADLERRLASASDNLVTLQDALLPESLPIAPGVRLAARYLLAEDGARAGGDWFDAVALDDGRVVLAVGDVVGHGVRASVVMGELRTLFEERVRLDGDVVAALEVLERRAARVPQARAATVCAAVLDPSDGSLVYCTAGHPPPLVVAASGEAEYLPVTGAGALGSGMPLESRRHVLAEGDLVLLYSDGLVERPGRTPVQNTLDLSRVAAEVVGGSGADESPATSVARETVARLIDETGFGDDITVLAAQRTTPPDPLAMTVPAFPDTLRAVRQNLGDWLAAIGVGQLDELALQHAVGELVSNAVEHAYEPERARHEAVVSVQASLVPGGVVEIEVSDRGTWRPPGPAGTRGRGLAMASGFSDDLRVDRGEHGTRAVLRQRPTTAVDLLTGASIGGVTGPDEPMRIRQDDGLVELSGALDQRSADELRRRLAHATRGGIVPVLVDLSAVTFLGSAAVQVLFDAMLTGREGEQPALTLVAPAGSPAQHVLEVVRLPYTTDRAGSARTGSDLTD